MNTAHTLDTVYIYSEIDGMGVLFAQQIFLQWVLRVY